MENRAIDGQRPHPLVGAEHLFERDGVHRLRLFGLASSGHEPARPPAVAHERSPGHIQPVHDIVGIDGRACNRRPEAALGLCWRRDQRCDGRCRLGRRRRRRHLCTPPKRWIPGAEDDAWCEKEATASAAVRVVVVWTGRHRCSRRVVACVIHSTNADDLVAQRDRGGVGGPGQRSGGVCMYGVLERKFEKEWRRWRCCCCWRRWLRWRILRHWRLRWRLCLCGDQR